MKKAKWWLLPLSIVVVPLTFMIVLIRGLILAFIERKEMKRNEIRR